MSGYSDEAFRSDPPFDSRYFTDESYEASSAVKKQIAAVNFYFSLNYDLSILLSQCAEVAKPDNIRHLVHGTYELMQRKVRE